ncbi:NUDIX domain-containing protein [Nocardia cyriacigeorgica]|uniref:NUDIX domain-containing protein n=1 Tax=Nocardia cyriacigeorgica TaxID=135487 RepID=UPI002454DAA9|nr:NUDIX domain-containing protein [Nocardia cyriacigeorgica]
MSASSLVLAISRGRRLANRQPTRAPCHSAPSENPRSRVRHQIPHNPSTPRLRPRRPPEAGTQIPAGGVHPGEALDTAVLREVAEETGLTNVSITDRIAVDDHPTPSPTSPAEQPSTTCTPNPTHPTPGSTKSTAKEPTTV